MDVGLEIRCIASLVCTLWRSLSLVLLVIDSISNPCSTVSKVVRVGRNTLAHLQILMKSCQRIPLRASALIHQGSLSLGSSAIREVFRRTDAGSGMNAFARR